MTPRETADSAICNAELAMHAAKRQGGDRLAVYTPAMDGAAMARLDELIGRDRTA